MSGTNSGRKYNGGGEGALGLLIAAAAVAEPIAPTSPHVGEAFEKLINTADRELTPALPCAKKRRANWGVGEAFEKLKKVAEYLQQNPSCSLRSAAINNGIPESVLRRHVTKMKNPEYCTRRRGRPPT